MASRIPGARFVPLESANHLLLESEPAWQRFTEELERSCRARRAAATVFAELTPRERDLVELIAQGRDNAQIAAQLGSQRKDRPQPHHAHFRQARSRESRAGDRIGPQRGFRRVPDSSPGTPVPCARTLLRGADRDLRLMRAAGASRQCVSSRN